MKTHIEISKGVKIPIIGFGTWQCRNPQELEKALDAALEAGYRHFDTAYSYGNEQVLGDVFSKWISSGKIKREDLFIVTKLPNQGVHPDRVGKFLKMSLNKLQMEYVDLYLIHHPSGLQTVENGIDVRYEANGEVALELDVTLEDVWKAMEDQVALGKARAVGVSNFSLPQLERIVKSCRIIPANHQLELNAAYPRREIREFCKKHGISVCAYAPLGSPGRKPYYEKSRPNNAHLKVNVPQLLDHAIVTKISAKHGKTPAQVLLRFLTQSDIIVIPKSVTPERIKSNIEIFDFSLDTDEMEELETLEANGEDGTWGFDWVIGLPGLEKHPEFHLMGVIPASVQ